MELRNEIEPQFDIAEKLYPKIIKLILDYASSYDENGDEENIEYRNMEENINKLTGKDMSQFNLWEWWETDGAENLAFDISLPDPNLVENIKVDELAEIIGRLKIYEELNEGEKSFKSKFYNYTIFGNKYYNKFLALNFKTYDDKLFQRNKDKSGNYFEYSIEEVIEKIWNNGNFK